VSDNKAFRVRTAGSSPIRIEQGVDGKVQLSFGENLPTELEYPVPDMFEMFFDLKEKFWPEIEKSLKQKGLSESELAAQYKKFNAAVMEVRKSTSEEVGNAIKKLKPDLEKLCQAFERVAKQKLLDAAHAVDEGEEKLRLGVEKVAKEFVK